MATSAPAVTHPGPRLARLALLLGAIAFVTRLPGLALGRMFNVDESYLAAMGLAMGRGGRLYLDAVDRKPPLLPWIYSLSQSLFGTEDLRLMRLVAAIGVLGAGLVVARLVVRLGGDRGGAVAGGCLVVLGSVAFPPTDGQAANFELFALLPAAAAVLVVVSARDREGNQRLLRFVAAGALVGIAGMIKQPFLAMLAPVGWEVWRGRSRPSAALATLGGLVASTVAVGMPFGLSAIWRWAWLDTGDYLGGRLDAGYALRSLALIVAVFLVLQAPTFVLVWVHRTHLRHVDPVVWAWVAGALIAIVPGFRFIVHYFQLLVPPLAVLGGLLLSGIGARSRRLVLGSAGAVALLCMATAWMPFADARQVKPDLVRAIQQNSARSDRILVWGALPEAYWRAGRLPAARFLSDGYVTGKWADRSKPLGNVELLEPFRSRWTIFNRDLRVHPPTIVVDTSTSDHDGWAQYAPGSYNFGTVLHRCYEQVGQVDKMTIWRLIDPACVRDAPA